MPSPYERDLDRNAANFAPLTPLGFLTGLLGINVGGIPGAQDPYAFWAVTAGLVLVVALEVWLLRRMRLL